MRYQLLKQDYSKTVSFTLDKPSYVYVSAYSTVCAEVLGSKWEALGEIEEFAVYSDANCSNLVLGDDVVWVYGNEKKEKYFCLDAGTYWIRFAKGNDDEYNAESQGEFRLTVAAQYLNVTGIKNGSWNRATKISTDKKVTGLLSSNTRTNWFKFTVAADTAVKKASISKLSNVKGKKAQVTYKKVSGAKGYEVQYSTNKKFKSGVKTKKVGSGTKKVTLTKLTKGKKYYVRVRAYKYDEDGNKVYGAWSNAKNVNIKK